MAFVQGTTGANLSATVDCDSINVTQGNIVCGYVLWDGNTVTLNSITDNSGNSRLSNIVLRNNPTTQGAIRAALFYADVASSGACVIRATISVSGLCIVMAHEVSATTTFDDSTMAGQEPPPATTNGVSSGEITTAVNGSYIFGASGNISSVTVTAGTSAGFVERTTTGAGPSSSEDQIQSTAGNIAAVFTAGSSNGTWITGVMAFNDGTPPPEALSVSVQDPVVGGSTF